MAVEKMFIPTFIANEAFQPAKVRPRLFFYNGQLETTPYKFKGVTIPFATVIQTINTYPYFDHFSTGSASQLPSTDSDSLLFFNEAASLGTTPTNSIYSTYWDTYISLLYNPKTRLIECSAIIPFADYVDLNLNDIIFFRGNHYHLRAINQYNLKTGECELQLLGPILPDSLDVVNQGDVPSTTTTSTSTSTSTSTTSTSTSTSTTSTSTTSTTTSPATPTAWDLTRCSDGQPSALTIPYNENYNAGVVILASDGNCYTLLQESFETPTLTVISEHGNCAECQAITTTSTSTTSTTTTSTTTTTTLAPLDAFIVSYDETNEQTACADTNTFTVYSNCSTIVTGGTCYLYNTANVGDPVIGGYYADSVSGNWYYTEGSNGLVQDVGSCGITTTTTTSTTPPPCNSVTISTTSYSTAAQACSAQPAGSQNKTDGDPFNPQVGDLVFTDVNCTTLKPAGIYYHQSAAAAITVNTNGTIILVEYC